MQFAILRKDINKKHTFWTPKKKKKLRSFVMNKVSVYAIALRSNNTAMSAIRSNVGSFAVMKSTIYAASCHVASSNNNNFHDHCPDGPNS